MTPRNSDQVVKDFYANQAKRWKRLNIVLLILVAISVIFAVWVKADTASILGDTRSLVMRQSTQIDDIKKAICGNIPIDECDLQQLGQGIKDDGNRRTELICTLILQDSNEYRDSDITKIEEICHERVNREPAEQSTTPSNNPPQNSSSDPQSTPKSNPQTQTPPPAPEPQKPIIERIIDFINPF